LGQLEHENISDLIFFELDLRGENFHESLHLLDLLSSVLLEQQQTTKKQTAALVSDKETLFK